MKCIHITWNSTLIQCKMTNNNKLFLKNSTHVRDMKVCTVWWVNSWTDTVSHISTTISQKQNLNSKSTFHNHNTVRWPNNFTVQYNTQITFSIIFMTISFHILAFWKILFLQAQIPKCLPDRGFNTHFFLQETHIKSATKWHIIIVNRDVLHGRIFPTNSTELHNVHKCKPIPSFLQLLNVSDIFDSKTFRIAFYK